MNADQNPSGTFQPPAQNGQPVSGQQPVRRAGILPTSGQQPTTGAAGAAPSGSVPQRSAFRPTTASPASAPTADPAAAPASGQVPPVAPAPRSTFPPATAAGAASGAAAAAPVAASADAEAGSISEKVKKLRGKAADAAKVQLERSDRARAAEADLGPRKARVLLSRIDPWSALKMGFLLSIAAGIMLVVAMHILWTVLNSMGVPALMQEWVSKLFSGQQEINILQFITYAKVMSATLLIAVLNVVLLTGLSTVGALLYNTISRVVGGVYVTLTDD